MPIYLEDVSSDAGVVPLEDNKRIQLYINTRDFQIKAADGSSLGADFKSVFYTHATPTYTTVEAVQIEGGDLIEAIPEGAVYLQIYAASTQIDSMLLYDPATQFPDQTSRNYLFWQRARTEFVKCKTIADLTRASMISKGTQVGRRTLADFSIDAGGQFNLINQARGLLTDMHKQCQYWLDVLYSGGAADFKSPNPALANFARDRATGIGRGWVAGGPTMNTREVPSDGSTRPRRFYYPNPIPDQNWS